MRSDAKSSFVDFLSVSRFQVACIFLIPSKILLRIHHPRLTRKGGDSSHQFSENPTSFVQMLLGSHYLRSSVILTGTKVARCHDGSQPCPNQFRGGDGPADFADRGGDP